MSDASVPTPDPATVPAPDTAVQPADQAQPEGAPEPAPVLDTAPDQAGPAPAPDPAHEPPVVDQPATDEPAPAHGTDTPPTGADPADHSPDLAPVDTGTVHRVKVALPDGSTFAHGVDGAPVITAEGVDVPASTLDAVFKAAKANGLTLIVVAAPEGDTK